VPLVLFTVAALAVVAWPMSRAIGAAVGPPETPQCPDTTEARMLDRQGSGAHALPPGHPPIPGRTLPPGHPPIPEAGEPPGHPRIPSSPGAPLFEAPAILTI
jgi:hypothetical protein